MDWIGWDWIGLAELDWIGMEWNWNRFGFPPRFSLNGLDWFGLDWIGVD